MTPFTPSADVQAAVEAFAARMVEADPLVVAMRDAELPMAVSDPTLPDNPVIYVNAAFEELTGYAAADIIGRNCRLLQGPLTAQEDVTRLRQAIAARQRIRVDLLNHRRDGTAFWNRLTVTPVLANDGSVRHFVASQIDVTLERHRLVRLQEESDALKAEVAEREAALAERALQLQIALRAGGLGYWSFDIASQSLDASSGCKAIFGRGPDETLTFAEFGEALHPDDMQAVQQAIVATIADGAECSIEYRILTRSGELRWVMTRGEVTGGQGGAAMIGFTTDITERKFAEEHRAVLAQELTHRVKNTLATVGAVVSQTLRNAESMADARIAVAGRIASLGAAHDLLIRDEAEGAAIGEVVDRVLMPFADAAGAVFSIDGPEIRLTPSITLALAMALHELTTNAVKYGALSVPGGRVDIRWWHGEGEEQNRFHFAWAESGGPPVTPPTRTGFGTRMIARVLAQHVRGQASILYPPEGVRFVIDAMI